MPEATTATICRDLQNLSRTRKRFMKSRIAGDNQMQAGVACTLGYYSAMEEASRVKMFKEASIVIKNILDVDVVLDPEPEITTWVKVQAEAIKNHRAFENHYNNTMKDLVKQLPVADWVAHENQKGFGLGSLAVVVGETGDLSNYSNPRKVWGGMGFAPWSFDGEPLMGKTWRSRSGMQRKLNKDEWTKFGYSPRRRSVSYIIGEGLMKQNGEGPYRKRYEDAKALAAEKHPDWTRCSKCDGTGHIKTAKCGICKGKGVLNMHCHLHGMLLATKLLFKNLWIEWNKDGGDQYSTPYRAKLN